MTSAALWINETFAQFDYAVLEFLHKLHASAAGAFFTPFLTFITYLGEDGLFLILLSCFLLLFKKTRKAGGAMLFAICVGALFTNLTIKPLIARPRPYVSSEVFHQWWEYAGSHLESKNSFPSGHTTSAMAAMTGLFFVTDKRISWTAFIFALLMGVSRMYLCVHYPSDVLGGLIIGFVAGLIAGLIVNAVYKKLSEKEHSLIVDGSVVNIFKKKK